MIGAGKKDSNATQGCYNVSEFLLLSRHFVRQSRPGAVRGEAVLHRGQEGTPPWFALFGYRENEVLLLYGHTVITYGAEEGLFSGDRCQK